MLYPLLITFISFALALGLTGAVLRVLTKQAVLDIPNERSSHGTPTPRGGGWALVAILMPALIGAGFFIDGDGRHVGLVAALALLAGISWLDDQRGVNPIARLGLHLLVAALGTYCFAPDAVLLGGFLPFWLDRAVMIVGWAWFINVYNFMDGIDGITGVETVSIATGLCLAMTAAGIADPFVDFITLVLTGACLGFLAYNWQPARLFLGDVGSVPLGYLTGFCLISLATRGYAAAAFILPLYYLADSGITITRRAWRGEKIWQAHRQHFYQIAAAKVGHAKISLLIAATNVGLIIAAMASVAYPWAAIAAALGLVGLTLSIMRRMAMMKVST